MTAPDRPFNDEYSLKERVQGGYRRNTRGRPSKFTEERRRIILDNVVSGVPHNRAAQLAGINESTLLDWLADPRAAYRLFSQEFEAAEAQCEANIIGDIVRQGFDNRWTALAWYAERRWPERWGKVGKYEVSGPNGGPIQIQGSIMSVLIQVVAEFVPPERHVELIQRLEEVAQLAEPKDGDSMAGDAAG